MIQHDVLIEEVPLECAAILAEYTPCTLGGNTCEEMGGPFVEWTLVWACVFGHVWKEGIGALEVN